MVLNICLEEESMAIYKVTYDTENRELTVFFHSNINKGYVYPSVPKDEVLEFIKAESKGKFFHSNIKKYGVARQVVNEGLVVSI